MKKNKIFARVSGVVLATYMLAALGGCADNTPAPVVTPPAAPTPASTPAPTPPPAQEEGPALFTPGTFTGTSDSYGGTLTASVTFEAGRIADISIDHADTASFARRAIPTIPQMILHRQSTLDIDAIASATLTTDAVINAVNDAIEQAGANPADLTPYIPTQPLPGATFIAGQQIVETTSWEDSPMIMQVVFSESEIIRVQVLEHGDTTTGGNWAGRSIPIIPHRVEEVQSTVGIDTVSGATITSGSVLALIDEAITLAGANPASLQPRTLVAGNFWPYGAGGGQQARFHPGIYYATVDGFAGPMTIQAIFSRGALVRVRVYEHEETESFFEMVFPPGQGVYTLANVVEQEQSIHGIDVTAGATATHNAFLEAVAEAVRMAGADPADF
ncbi:MAG: FMN-binding protein [Defluviitaleaceae bacterium]|nr:FMN-binding protein [Defluviitaleaceae bacterium]